MIATYYYVTFRLVGAIVVAAPANADQYDFVSFLDNNGVYYASISDVIEWAKLSALPPVALVLRIWQSTGSSPSVTTPMLSAAQS
jgi:hypothetical protein